MQEYAAELYSVEIECVVERFTGSTRGISGLA